MILREIDLDLDFSHDNYIALFHEDYNNVNSIEVYSKNWKDRRFIFSLEVRCMASMISRLMEKKHYGDFRKICFHCLLYEAFFVNISGEILDVGIRFDYNKFNSLSNYEKKIYTVNFILEGIILIENSINTDMSEIKNAIEIVKQNNYHNEWIWKSLKKKNETISIHIFHDIQFAKVYMRHEIGSNFISEQVVRYVLPDEWFYHTILGKLIRNGDEVSLIDKEDHVLLKESFCT